MSTLETVVDNKSPFVSMPFNSLTGFHFKDHVTVNIESNFIWQNFVELQIIKKTIFLKRMDEYFTINSFDINGPILINETKNCCEIFLCLANPPNFYRNKERAPFEFNNRSFSLRLKSDLPIDIETAWKLRKAFDFFSMQVYHVSNLKQQTVIVQKEDELSSFEKSYLVKTWHSKHAAVLPAKLPKAVIANFNTATNLQLLLDNTFPERFQKLRLHDFKDEAKPPFTDLVISSNYVKFGRIKVTPSRFIFMPMIATPKSRVFRYFPNPENFLLVSLIDEHDGNPWQSQAVYDWFLSVLINGIRIGGKIFTFLGCSNSQLREGHCWFSCVDRRMVYDKIGHFPEEMSAGRKLTRLALAFASSIETVPLNHERYLRSVAADVKNELGVLFSDGIGRASRDLFSRVTSMLHLQSQPSAFQIRVGGVKGVISVYDNQQDDVMFRESMKKFESNHNMLEVLAHSRSIELRLNRHVILLLSNFGVPDQVFIELQFNELEKCMEALIDDEKALGFVKSRSTFIRWEMYPPDRVIQEPLFRGMLYSNAIELFQNVVEHAHISIDKGRVLMGVMDETNTLEYGEVYAHIVENDFELVLEGQVVVFRNPAVLPSDVRLLNARSKNLPQSFKNLYKNCLVVPAAGPGSHAHECSGGDLDGDLYYIIWDERLIPPNLPSPGVEVIEVETTQSSPVTGNSDQEMIEFFCDFSSNFQLGVIANAHLATADKFGMNDPKSIELARYVTAETDAPKKGLTVGRIASDLLPKEYPDYMRKGDKPTYRSETVLGELYRQAYPLLEILLESRTKISQHRRIVLSGDEGTVESCYSLYTMEVKRLMSMFELTMEVDLFSGTPTWRSGYVSKYKQQNQLRETVGDHVKEFWSKWQLIFEKWRVKNGNDQQKILEWYNRPKSCKWPIHSFSFLAMPFVDFEASTRKTIIDLIQISTMQWIHYNKMQLITEWVRRHNVGLAVIDKLKGVECHFYGSSMLGLSEEYSDIDLYAANENFNQLSVVLRGLDPNAVALVKPNPRVSLT
jgi:RNA dependent RNA polymerase